MSVAPTLPVSPGPTHYRSLQSATQPAQSRHREVQFQGVGDAVSSFISLIDRNRAIELAASDGLGMLAPRTAMATGFRGVDDGRETLIREGAGLFCVALLAGVSNQFMTRVLGNRVNFYNPHGTPARAWIGAKTLNIYSQLYHQALQTAQSPQDARATFIESVLNGLESGDRQLSIDGVLSNLKTLSQKPENKGIVEKAMTQMLTASDGKPVAPTVLEAHFNALTEGKTTTLRDTLLTKGWGELSQTGKQELRQWFQPINPKSDPLKGTQNFDCQAWERIAELEQQQPLANRDAKFIEERLKLSLTHLGSEDARFIKAVDELALNHGLTSVVHLKRTPHAEANATKHGEKTVLLAEQSRQTLLKELKYFLEHFVDRASDVAQTAQPQWAQQRALIQQTLFAPAKSGWRGLIPHAEEGLVTAALKSKTGYTVIPIGIAIAANFITTFMNNYITQKKHFGRVFFPGEEAALKLSTQMTNALSSHNVNPFSGISQTPFNPALSQKGFIA